MSINTKIEWVDSTWNPWSGCKKVSPGCANCYAETLSNRFPHFGKWGRGAHRRLHESAFKLARRLNRKPWVCDECGSGCKEVPGRGELHPCPCGADFHRRRIFSLSLGDWLDPEIPIEWLARMLDTIRLCKDVNWLLLTKRPELWAERLRAVLSASWDNNTPLSSLHDWVADWRERGNPPPRIWLGASVEDQKRADERIPALLRIPAAKRILSCEPLLGPVDLAAANMHASLEWLSWVIISGDSGPRARPCVVEWIRSLVEDCENAAVPVFVKQLGSLTDAWLPMGPHKGKNNDPVDWPDAIRVREVPE